MADKIARRLLGNLLAAARIDEGTFYRLAGALFECPHIDPESVMLTEPARGEFEFTARYIGPLQIGNAMMKKRRVSPLIKANVEGIYQDISERSGIQFTGVFPSLQDVKRNDGFLPRSECTGYVKLSRSAERGSHLYLTLYQTAPEPAGG